MTDWRSIFTTRAPRTLSPTNTISPLMTAAAFSSRKIMLCSRRSANGDGASAGGELFAGDTAAAARAGETETGASVDAGPASSCAATKFVRTTMLVLTLIRCLRRSVAAGRFAPSTAGAGE